MLVLTGWWLRSGPPGDRCPKHPFLRSHTGRLSAHTAAPQGQGGGEGHEGKGKGKGKAGTVAAVATVDQFIRHAESGFFGDDEEADCPFVWDGDC